MPRDSQDVDLVTITFEGDIRLTVLQILSVDRLLDHSNIGRYIVVLNGQDNARLEGFLKTSTESRIAPGLAAKIDYVNASTLLPGHDPLGWRGQQLLKLVVANHLAARYYLVLHAKNHFVHRTLVRVLLYRNGNQDFPSSCAPELPLPHQEIVRRIRCRGPSRRIRGLRDAHHYPLPHGCRTRAGTNVRAGDHIRRQVS